MWFIHKKRPDIKSGLFFNIFSIMKNQVLVQKHVIRDEPLQD